VKRGRAAEGDHAVFRQLLAIFDGVHAGGVRHVFIHDFAHAKGGCLLVDTKLFAHVVRDRLA
jgi:hypothetical protein